MMQNARIIFSRARRTGAYDVAARSLRRVIEGTDPRSLITLSRLYDILREVLLAAGDLVGAEAATLKQVEIDAAIGRVEATEPKIMRDNGRIQAIRSACGGLERRKKEVRLAFAKLRKVKASRGSIGGRARGAEVEETTIALTKAFHQGKITRAQLQRSLAHLRAELTVRR